MCFFKFGFKNVYGILLILLCIIVLMLGFELMFDVLYENGVFSLWSVLFCNDVEIFVIGRVLRNVLVILEVVVNCVLFLLWVVIYVLIRRDLFLFNMLVI